MLASVLLVVAFLVTVGLSVLWAFLRGLAKARIRGISIIACLILSIVITILMRGALLSDGMVDGTIIPILEDNGLSQVVEMLGFSETLNEVILNVIVSLISPIVCVLIFFLLSFLSWAAFLVVTLIMNNTLREHNEKCQHQRVRAMIWGGVQGLVLFTVMLIPIGTYMSFLPPVMEAVVEAEGAEENESAVQEVVDAYVEPLSKNPCIVVYRYTGGGLISDALTNFTIADHKTDFKQEVDSIASFACNILTLSKTEFEKYGSNEANVIVAVADSFEDSVLLPTIAGEIIYGATDSWLLGEPFLGATKPDFGEMSEVFDPFFESLLRILHSDSRNHAALQADIHTVADIVAIFAEYGVFEDFSDTEALMESLSSNGIVPELIETLGENESMKALIPEITNLGMRAIATTLGLPADADAVYGTLMADIADALNDASNLSGSQQVEAITQDLVTAFDEAGIPVDKEIVSCYSASMIEDLLNEADGEDLTADDVQAFFSIYAMELADSATSQSNDSNSSGGLAASGPINDLSDILEGTVYEDWTEEDLKKSGAYVLASASRELLSLGNAQEDTTDRAREILANAYSELLADKEETLNLLLTVELKNGLSQDSFQAGAGLYSVDTMITCKITMEDLLVDSQIAAGKINSETLANEAQAIESIFTAATDLMNTFADEDEMQLDQIAGSVGEILDSLNTTATFGSDKTANLFTAVMQSKTVREVADMDMATATQMAQKATQGNGNYTDTMNAVSGSVTVLTKLGKDNEELTEEELIDLIRNINPPTAGMIEVYVTPARIVGYGVEARYADTSAELLSNTFSFMANTEMAEDEYEKEAKALNQVLNIAISAKSHSSGRKLFGEVLPGATETVNVFMDSHAITYALRETMLDANGEVKEGRFDVFDLSERIAEGSAEYIELVQALESYAQNHSDNDTKLTVKALSALFGVPIVLD